MGRRWETFKCLLENSKLAERDVSGDCVESSERRHESHGGSSDTLRECAHSHEDDGSWSVDSGSCSGAVSMEMRDRSQVLMDT